MRGFLRKNKGGKRNPSIKAKITMFKSLNNPKIAMWYLERRDPAFMRKLKDNAVISRKARVEIVKRNNRS